jgi:hypothetical protein
MFVPGRTIAQTKGGHLKRLGHLFFLVAAFVAMAQAQALSIGALVELNGYGRGIDESGRVLLTRTTGTTIEDWLWSPTEGYSLVFARAQLPNELAAPSDHAAGPTDWFNPALRTDVVPVIIGQTNYPVCELQLFSCAGEWYVPSVEVGNINFSTVLGHYVPSPWKEFGLRDVLIPLQTELQGVNAHFQILIRPEGSQTKVVFAQIVPEPGTNVLLVTGCVVLVFVTRRARISAARP